MTLLLARPSWAGIADGTRAGAFPGLTNEIVNGTVTMETHPVMGKVAHHSTPANTGSGNQRCEMVVSHRNLVPGDHVFHSAWYMAGSAPTTIAWHLDFQFKNQNVGAGSGPSMSMDANQSNGSMSPGAWLANGENTYSFKLVDNLVPCFLIFEFIVTKGPGTGSEVAVWVWRPGQSAPVYASPTVRKTNWLSTRENGPGGLIFDQVTGGAYLKHGPYHIAPAPYVIDAWWGPPCTSIVSGGDVAGAFTEALGPSNLQPAAPHIEAAPGNAKVTITRGPITGARAGDFWQLYRATSAAFTAPTTVNASIALATTTYEDTGLQNGTTYYYRASVGNPTNGFGSWDAANTPSATPVAPTPPPPPTPPDSGTTGPGISAATVVRSTPPEEAGPATVVRASRTGPVQTLPALSFTGQQGDVLPAQTVILPFAGTAFAVTTDQTWLTANPVQVTAPGPLSVGVNLAGLAAGEYQGAVTASTALLEVRVPVTLTVTAALDPVDVGDEIVFTGSGFLPGTLVRVIPRLPGVDPPDKREWVADAGYGLSARRTVLLSRPVLAERTVGVDTSWSASLPRGPYWAVGTRDGELSYVAFTA